MRVLIQRVKEAKVVAEGKKEAEIRQGLLLLVNIAKDDEEADIKYLSKKVTDLRIFQDNLGKMNLSVKKVNGQVLSVPQFTLYADTRKGNRPGFDISGEPKRAKEYWERFNELLRDEGIDVKEGYFGLQMDVALINDGPVTIWLDSKLR